MAIQTDGATLKVATVQFRSSADVVDNLRRIRSQLEPLQAQGVRVAAFPECAATSYSGPAIEACTPQQLLDAEAELSRISGDLGMYIVMGIPYFENDTRLNGALVFNPSGQCIERYAKIQLAGEKWCESGNRLALFRVDDVLCSVMVCHDSRYPEITRLPAIAGAQVMFYISCESGILAESKIGPYRAQVQARAVENSIFVVQSNAPANMATLEGGEEVAAPGGSHGQSRIVAPDGNLIAEAGFFDETSLVATLDLEKATRGLALRSPQSTLFEEWWHSGLELVPEAR